MKSTFLKLTSLIIALIIFSISENNVNAQLYTKDGAISSHTLGNNYVGMNNASPKAPVHIGTFFTMASTPGGWTNLGHNYYWYPGSGPRKIQANKGTVRVSFTNLGDMLISTAPTGNNTLLNNLTNRLVLKNDGRVMIGEQAQGLGLDNTGALISTNSYKLFVEKGILTEKVKVALRSTADWADYVFEQDYDLNSIETVETFVKENKHLPNIPSAETVVSEGINVAEMDAKLLRQIEELWLHVIELNKKNETLEAEVQLLKKN